MAAAKGLLELPLAAQKRFQAAADEHQQLIFQLNAQRAVLSDLASSLGDLDALSSSLANVEEQSSALDRTIAGAGSILLDTLNAVQRSGESPEGVNGITKQVITTVQDSFTQACLGALSAGSTVIPIFKLLELEDAIRNIIEDLHEKQMFPETEEESTARNQETQEHMQRVLQLLQAFSTEAPDDGEDS
jgi:hypothetical protein